MIRRVLVAAFLALVSGAWFGGHGGGGSAPPPSDPITTLIANTIATCGHNCLVQLNAPTGNGSPYQVLLAYGLNAGDSTGPHDFNGATNDAYPNGKNLVGQSGLDPTNDQHIFSYSAPAFRQGDGKVVAVATGGHTASGVSMVLTFDVAAAATNLNGGGSGGAWQVTVKPARTLLATDPRPSWSPQPAADAGSGVSYGWVTTNPDGVQMPLPCHEYWSNHWIPGTHKSVWSGYFCGVGGGKGLGGAGHYDDDLLTVGFPDYVAPAGSCGQASPGGCTDYGYLWHGVHFDYSTDAISDVDQCLYVFIGGGLYKWCSLGGLGVAGPTLVGGTGQDEAPPYTESIMVPQPGAISRRMFLNFSNGNCFSTGVSCFFSWSDTGATPATSFSYKRIFFTNGIPAGLTWQAMGMCYDAALNAVLAWNGGKNIYKIADMTTGQLSTNTGGGTPQTPSNWGFSLLATANGSLTPYTTADSGAPASCGSLEPNYPALVLFVVDESVNKATLWLYVK